MSWASSKSPGGTPRSTWRVQILLFIFILVCLCGLISSIVWSFNASAADSRWMPLSLHSILQSDYSVDARTELFPPVKIELIKNYLDDMSASDSPARYSTLLISMNTPIATVTPNNLAAILTPTNPSPASTLPPTATATLGLFPTSSILPTRPPTLTPTPTPTSTPTVYPSETAWNTPTQMPSPTPTSTPRHKETPVPTKPGPTQTLPASLTPTLPKPTQQKATPTLPKATSPYPPPYP